MTTYPDTSVDTMVTVLEPGNASKSEDVEQATVSTDQTQYLPVRYAIMVGLHRYHNMIADAEMNRCSWSVRPSTLSL